jgi:peptidoglycan/xylan/chitin deacetylase (PgdA/CDA1 family)
MVRNNLLLFLFLFSFFIKLNAQSYDLSKSLRETQGAYYRADTTKKIIYLVFTAHEYDEGMPFVISILDSLDVKASFFLTGDYVRRSPQKVRQLYSKGHYVGAHSNKHLLYCDWGQRDSLLETLSTIAQDIKDNLEELKALGVPLADMKYFMPPYEWYNRKVYELVTEMGLLLINFTPGTSSNADYTTPEMKNYLSSDSIMQRLMRAENNYPAGLNGFHLLVHVGTAPQRLDKLYTRLPEIIQYLRRKDYQFNRFE